MNETTVDKIFGFKQLDDGWCYGEGKTISPETIEKAIRLEARARLVGFAETDAFPGLNGEISVALYWQSHYFEFTFNPDESVLFVHEDNQTIIVYDDTFTFDLALQHLESIKSFLAVAVPKTENSEKYLWPLSESFMNVFMTSDFKDIKVMPSNLHKTVEYQSLSKIVLSDIAAMYVPTFGNFTQKHTAPLPLIGSSTPISSLNIVE